MTAKFNRVIKWGSDKSLVEVLAQSNGLHAGEHNYFVETLVVAKVVKINLLMLGSSSTLNVKVKTSINGVYLRACKLFAGSGSYDTKFLCTV